ncbi:hypothetical protein C2845_PM04G12360 [Panicum miliaceum]|uniref:IBR domain-containing protein n=1 Tax=Panicum miliaceum TaxID=4540 RepID=A0A3L6QQU1_PANMI|nr:hypothetical protein C2845_PM04G12360 [Panicum miliaceum]
MEEEEEEDIVEKPLLLPMNALVQRLRPLHGDLPRNTDIITMAPHAAEAEQGVNRFDGFFNDEGEDEDYVDYIAIMVQAERSARTVPLERRTQALVMARQLKVAPLTDDEVAKFGCGICLETLLIFDIFHDMPCPYKFCVWCMGTYIEGRIHAGESDKLTENSIPPNKRVYCPNPECRIMLESTCTNTTPSKASCPMCNCQTCTTCGMDWSTDGSGQHDSAEGPEAMLMKKLATERRWK